MDEAIIAEGLAKLAASDPRIALAHAACGNPPPRIRPAGFPTLFNIIVSQQISSGAARAIADRASLVLGEVSPEAVLRTEPERLREAGLSARKVDYVRRLAEAIVSGRFDPGALAGRDDEEAIASISALPGFGRWSAEIYLMFALGRRDVFPAGDLALRVALMRLGALAERPTEATARALAARWSPWRSVASLFLWHYYRGAPT